MNEWDQVRNCILQHGWNSTCYQLLNPGFQYWVSTEGDAVAGYVEYAGTRIVGGSPVCAFERLPDIVSELEADSAAHGIRVCYFASEARLESVVAQRAERTKQPSRNRVICFCQSVAYGYWLS